MKNTILRLAFVMLIMTSTAAGALAQFSGGLEFGLPVGDFSNGSNPGLGASIRYDYLMEDKISWTFSVGYLSYDLKSSTGVDGRTSMVPLMGGFKFYFNESNNGIYGAFDLGFVPITLSVASAKATETRVGLSPGVGYRIGQFDFAARYNLISDFSSIGIRAAYVF